MAITPVGSGNDPKGIAAVLGTAIGITQAGK
jgi:hypothetical protein